jgi:hypothetical protein
MAKSLSALCLLLLVSSITCVFYYLCLLLLVVALPVPARAGDPLVELGEQLFTSSG